MELALAISLGRVSWSEASILRLCTSSSLDDDLSASQLRTKRLSGSIGSPFSFVGRCYEVGLPNVDTISAL